MHWDPGRRCRVIPRHDAPVVLNETTDPHDEALVVSGAMMATSYEDASVNLEQ